LKPRTGTVFLSERYGRYVAKLSATHPITQKIKQWERHAETSREAHNKLTELKVLADEWIQNEAPESLDPAQMTFDDLAKIFETKKLIPAEYVAGVKVAGRRELSSPKGWLTDLKDFFKKKKIRSIKFSDLEDLKLYLVRRKTKFGGQRSVASINRELEFCRTVLNFGVTNGYLKKNPFRDGTGKPLIDRQGETKRERFPTFGEELALLKQCVDYRDHLESPLIIAVDTGLRQNEMFTLEIRDLDFKHGVIKLRKENAKSNRDRDIPMTARVRLQFHRLLEQKKEQAKVRREEGIETTENKLVFDGFHDPRHAWSGAKKYAKVTNLNWHDLRHAFVSRSILAGIPPAVVLKASGHASEEWKRYLNTTPDQLRGLLAPLDGQTAEDVKLYAAQVMRGLRDAMRYEEIEQIFAQLK
jgi:integrase